MDCNKRRSTYEKNFGSTKIGKAKKRLLPWEQHLLYTKYISEYKNFIPSPRGNTLDNKVPMIRLMKHSPQKYSSTFKSKVASRGNDFDLVGNDNNNNSNNNNNNTAMIETTMKIKPRKIKSPPLSFESSPPRPDGNIMLQSMGMEYKSQRPRFEPNADLKGPAKFHSTLDQKSMTFGHHHNNNNNNNSKARIKLKGRCFSHTV